MQFNLKQIFLKTILPVILICTFFFISMTPFSCRQSAEGIEFLQGDFNTPLLESFSVLNQNSVFLTFDKAVNLTDTKIYNYEEKQNLTTPLGQETNAIYSSDCKAVTVNFTNPTLTGLTYFLEGCVLDQNKNSLTFSISFTGFNSTPADLAINEVRNAYSSSTNSSSEIKTYKCEFIELIARSDGNLAGIEIINASEAEKKYSLPPVEVKKGDYITVHLRSMEEGCINETGDDISLSFATDSCDSARDFWQDNQKARLGLQDIIIIQNSADKTILDALLYTTSAKNEWSEDFEPYLKEIENQGAWTDTDGNITTSISSALITDYITSSATTRTISRQNISCAATKAGEWIITCNKGSGANKVSGDTPGYKNSPNVYTK